MSATNRQRAARDRFDFNITPRTLCAAVCTRLPIDTHARILEPSAGTGAWVSALRAGRPAAHIEAIETQARLRPALRDAGADRVWTADFTKWRNRDPAGMGVRLSEEDRPLFDWIVGNPPYAKPSGRVSQRTGKPIMTECVGEHVDRAMRLLRPGGHLAFLLRVAWFAPPSRDALLAKYPVKHLLLLSHRPSFRGGKTDATEYAIFLWERGWRGGSTTIERMGGGPWKD